MSLNIKKQQKYLVVMLTLMILSLAGCGSSRETAAADGALNVAALLNGTLGDRSFFDSVNQGMEAIAAIYGVNTKVIEAGYDETALEPALADLCQQDWDIIICGTWQMADLVQDYALQYPQKRFILFDTSFDFEAGDYSNVYAMMYKQNEGSYLAGALAALLTGSGMQGYNADKIIGFIGGTDTAVINDFLVGYIQGAVETDGDVRVNVSYVHSFTDTGKAKELALAQYHVHTDIIFSAATTAGLGVLDAAKDKGLYAIGVDADQGALFQESDPQLAALIPTSMMKQVDQSIVRAIGKELENDLPWGTEESLGIAEGCIGLAKNSIYFESVPEEIRGRIEEIEAGILSGHITVGTAIGMESGELAAMIDAVKP